MRAHVAALILLACVVALKAEQTPASPDFSGEWTIDLARSQVSPETVEVPATRKLQEGVVEPRTIKKTPPRYPSDARDAGASGTVLLQGILDTKGHVADLRIVKSIPVFDQAAMAAVWQWEYTPTLLKGQAVEVFMTVVVNFENGSGPQPLEAVPVPLFKGSFGSGLGLGTVFEKVLIRQDPKKLTLLRGIAGQRQVVIYAPGTKSVTNTIENYGSAKNNQYKYASRWDNGRLVTNISWSGPGGSRSAKETIARDADTLTIATSRQDPVTAADAFTQTLVYTRKQ